MTTEHYQKLITRFNDWLLDIETHEVRDLAEGIDFLSEWAQTGLSVTSESLQQQLHFLKRDLQTFYTGYQYELKESAYCQSINEQLWHTLTEMTDKTQIEWAAINTDFKHDGCYKAGEEIALGTLVCEKCGEQKVIKHVQTITPCIECYHINFIRLNSEP